MSPSQAANPFHAAKEPTHCIQSCPLTFIKTGPMRMRGIKTASLGVDKRAKTTLDLSGLKWKGRWSHPTLDAALADVDAGTARWIQDGLGISPSPCFYDACGGGTIGLTENSGVSSSRVFAVVGWAEFSQGAFFSPNQLGVSRGSPAR